MSVSRDCHSELYLVLPQSRGNTRSMSSRGLASKSKHLDSALALLAREQVAGGEVDGWYQVIRADGRQGLVPSSYVQL